MTNEITKEIVFKFLQDNELLRVELPDKQYSLSIGIEKSNINNLDLEDYIAITYSSIERYPGSITNYKRLTTEYFDLKDSRMAVNEFIARLKSTDYSKPNNNTGITYIID